MIHYRTNLDKAATDLIHHVNPAIDRQACKEIILSDPSYPSLLSASNALDELHIAHEAARVNGDRLEELPKPFIAYGRFSRHMKDFFIVQDLDDHRVRFRNELGQSKWLSKEEFLKLWDGVALYAKEATHSGAAARTSANWGKPLLARLTVFMVMLPLLIWAFTAGIGFTILLKTLGIAITSLLLAYELNVHTDTIKQYCQAGKSTNCEAVLHSKGAKIFGLSWSELGWMYMVGSFGYILLAAAIGSAGMQQVASLLSLAVAPYVAYSIYYQYVVVKQWCLLCLAVQFVLVSDALVAGYSISTSNSWSAISFGHVWPLLMGGFVLLAWWVWVKPWLKKGVSADHWRFAYERLVNDRQVFDAMLARQPRVVKGYEQATLLFGNPNASVEVLKVCNPYCGPCSKAHPFLEEIIQRNADVKLRIAFVMADNDEHKIGQVVHQFVALYQAQGPATAAAAMHYWYMDEAKDVEVLKKKFPVEADIDTRPMRKAMAQWEKAAEIVATPTLFVNGHRLPRQYNWQNLKRVLVQST